MTAHIKLMTMGVLIFLLAGCASGSTPKDLALTPESEEGVIVLGLEPEGEHLPGQFIMAFRPIDPETKQVLKDVDAVYIRDKESLNKSLISLAIGGPRLAPILRSPSKVQGETEYRTTTFSPGTYALVYIYMQGTSYANADTLICASEASLIFDVKPGQAFYIGNMFLSEWGKAEIRRSGNFEAAKAAFNSQHQNIAIPLEKGNATVAPILPIAGKQDNSKSCRGYGSVRSAQTIRGIL